MGHNRIVTLPLELNELISVKCILLDMNKLETTPECISGMLDLEHLNLSSNFLSIMHPHTCTLTKLLTLNLGCNQLIENLPSEIGALTKLTSLNLFSNQLTILPDEIGCLTALDFLNVGNNMISFTPPSFCNLLSLTKLSIDDHDLVGESVVLPTALQDRVKQRLLKVCRYR